MTSARYMALPPAKKPRTKRTAGSTPPVAFSRVSIVAAVEAATKETVPPREVPNLFRDASEILLTDDGESWLYLVPQWYTRVYALSESNGALSYSDWFDAVWDLHPRECGTIKLFGKEIRTPRFQQAYGVTHRFSGATFPSQPFPHVLQHAVATIQRMLVADDSDTTCLTAGLLNWYANGDHYMGPHSDEGVNIRDDSPIFSLTLGPAVRRFVFTPRGAHSTHKKLELTLRDGDLLVMGGTTQKTHKHALPKMKRCRDRRVNVTLRYFK